MTYRNPDENGYYGEFGAQVFQFMYVEKTYSIIKRFFTLLRFVQNDRVLVCSHGLEMRDMGILGMGFLT